MLSLDEFIRKSGGKLAAHPDLRAEATCKLVERLTVCIPDLHLLEKDEKDDFWDGNDSYVDRLLDFLDFLYKLKDSEHIDLEIIQAGDLYDLWQAKGYTNLIQDKYTDILGLLDELGTVYLIGNHDFEIIEWYKDQGTTFNRRWRHFSQADNTNRVMYEHGYQADFWNNKDQWSGVIGEGITKVIGVGEYLYPDIDVDLDNLWWSVSHAFDVYNGGLTPRKNPKFSVHEYTDYYIRRMEKYNSGDTTDLHGPTDLALTVVGHTHRPRLVGKPRNGKIYYLMDCGSWVNGGHEIGVIAGNELAVCQWD
jgi:UDP-2,3-diacylglucosamine pyrophosphatase LpxH